MYVRKNATQQNRDVWECLYCNIELPGYINQSGVKKCFVHLLTLLVGRQKGIWPVKKLSGGVLAW